MQRITEPDLETETETDAARLRAACERDLGDPARWFPPPGYPDSLALCIVDAIFSSGARHSMTEKVIGRYREHRRALGGDPDRDGAVELLGTFATSGEPSSGRRRSATAGRRRPHQMRRCGQPPSLMRRKLLSPWESRRRMTFGRQPARNSLSRSGRRGVVCRGSARG